MDKKTFRLMVKNDKGRFQPVAGIDDLTGKALFVTNVIHGLCFWNYTEEMKEKLSDHIKKAYPGIEFELRQA